MANADKGAPLTLTLNTGLYAEHAINDVAHNTGECEVACTPITPDRVQLTIHLPPGTAEARKQIGSLLNQILIATLALAENAEPG